MSEATQPPDSVGRGSEAPIPPSAPKAKRRWRRYAAYLLTPPVLLGALTGGVVTQLGAMGYEYWKLNLTEESKQVAEIKKSIEAITQNLPRTVAATEEGMAKVEQLRLVQRTDAEQRAIQWSLGALTSRRSQLVESEATKMRAEQAAKEAAASKKASEDAAAAAEEARRRAEANSAALAAEAQRAQQEAAAAAARAAAALQAAAAQEAEARRAAAQQERLDMLMNRSIRF
jgi:membrane protein involved in colicin uptake